MGNDPSCVALGLKAWKTQIDRADELFGSLSSPFVSNPDRSRADVPSHEQVREAWNVVNAELWKGFETMSWNDWVQRHAAVSEEDFAKECQPGNDGERQ
jgi:hypothetical protein